MKLKFNHPRQISQIVAGSDTQDGAGVRLKRVMPAPDLRMLDPFLMLDVFSSYNPHDYIAGFPPHPHRGFEAVTYLLAGQVRHRDNAGHIGVVKAGGVQWMTAARGILHSEMPEQDNGLLQGFQLWVNLPAAQKMGQPHYQEYAPEQIPEEIASNGVKIRVIAGKTAKGVRGPVTGIATDTIFLDITLPEDTDYAGFIPDGYNSFIYLISGSLRLGGRAVTASRLAVLTDGDGVAVTATEASRLLLIAGRPIGEPVARQGPFVMNTDEEIQQAYRDYEDGLFGAIEDDHGHVA